MTEPTDESTPRPRPRPRAAVSGQRKAAPKSAPSKAAAAPKAAARRSAAPRSRPSAQPKAAKTSAARTSAAKTSTAGPGATRATAGRRTAGPTTGTTKTAAKRTRTTATGDAAAAPSKASSKATALVSTARRRQRRSAQQSGVNLVLVVLTVLALLAAAAVTVLVVQRVRTPPQVDPELLPAAADAYSAMYSFDYTDPDASVQDTLSVLTGDLRDQFEEDLDAQVVPSYLEVSATTRVDNITVGLQNINDEQTEAVVIAYGTFVVKSVNSGQEAAPAGSECAVTDDGADACVQTLQLNLDKVDGTWLVSAVTTLTTS